MGQILHGSARTTEAVRRAIPHSQERWGGCRPPRRHRNVPEKWCLQPLSGKDGNHVEGYNDWGGSRKGGFSAARCVDEWGDAVPQEAVAAEFSKFMTDQPPAVVVMEVCGSAHYWAREMVQAWP